MYIHASCSYSESKLIQLSHLIFFNLYIQLHKYVYIYIYISSCLGKSVVYMLVSSQFRSACPWSRKIKNCLAKAAIVLTRRG